MVKDIQWELSLHATISTCPGIRLKEGSQPLRELWVAWPFSADWMPLCADVQDKGAVPGKNSVGAKICDSHRHQITRLISVLSGMGDEPLWRTRRVSVYKGGRSGKAQSEVTD